MVFVLYEFAIHVKFSYFNFVMLNLFQSLHRFTISKVETPRLQPLGAGPELQLFRMSL